MRINKAFKINCKHCVISENKYAIVSFCDVFNSPDGVFAVECQFLNDKFAEKMYKCYECDES